MIAMKLTWHKLQPSDKLSLVQRLHNMRISLLEKARARRATKKTGKRKKKERAFRSDEFKRIFETMPDEMKKFLGG